MTNKRRFLITYLIYIIVILSVTSCENENLDATFDQIILSNQDKVLVDASNNFGFDLLKLSKSFKSNENIIISPFELSSDMNLLLNGSTGYTYEFINSYLNPSSLSVDEINNSYKRIYEAISGLSKNEILLVNGFWFGSGYGIKQQFGNISNYFYKTHIDSIDFTITTETDQIGNWLNSELQGTFDFNDLGISAQTQSLFVNGFSCNLNLKYFFQDSFSGTYYLSETDTLNLPMLRVIQSFNYFSHDYFNLIEIPYSNSSFSLIILLPKQNISVNYILSLLNSANWDNWIKNFTKTTINLTIPELNQVASIELGKYLGNSPFSFLVEESIDFYGITSNNSFKIDYLISQTNFKIQDNRIQFNKSDQSDETRKILESIEFNVNKPFLFAIKENSSNLILSAGIIENPIN